MPKHITKDYQNLRGVGKKAIYRIILKHRGELSEAFLKLLKKNIWEFMGDISMEDITIKKINARD